MTTRAATLDDAAAISAIEAQVDPEAWTVARVAQHLELAHGHGLVLTTAGSVVAHLLSTSVVDEVEIISIAVDPNHRGRGLGRALLLQALEGWQRQGTAQVFLEVRRDNTAAIALYAGQAFVQVGLRTHYYRDGCDALLMSRALSSA